MKIISIEYNDIEQEWGFGKISLFDLTLLVGVSGVGKTQILQSIYALKKIANGASLNGVKWDIDFQTLDGKSFSWKGEFENIINNSNFMSSVLADEDNKIEPKIVFEELQEIKSKNLIISRNLDKFFFNNVELPKLNSSESAINILKEVDLIAAEDTRHTLKLLNHLNISKPLISYYKQNENIKKEVLIDRILEGKNIAVVTDAGTPRNF